MPPIPTTKLETNLNTCCGTYKFFDAQICRIFKNDGICKSYQHDGWTRVHIQKLAAEESFGCDGGILADGWCGIFPCSPKIYKGDKIKIDESDDDCLDYFSGIYVVDDITPWKDENCCGPDDDISHIEVKLNRMHRSTESDCNCDWE